MGQVGDLLAGKYALESRLGAGAMGEVWKAKNQDLGREVAIKILRREHTGDREIVTRFLREARAANLVRHANVVDVLDVGEDAAGTPFLVQELLEGEDLGAHLTARGHGLPLRRGDEDPAAHRGGGRLRPRARGRPPRHQARERLSGPHG